MAIAALLKIVYLSISGQIPADPSWDKVRSELIVRFDELNWNEIPEDGYILMDKHLGPYNISIIVKIDTPNYSIIVSGDIVYNIDPNDFNSTDAADAVIAKLQTILI